MPEAGRPRVAIFQANWPLQVHTTNMIEVLTSRGYAVDLFLRDVDEDFATSGESSADGTTRVFDLSPAPARSAGTVAADTSAAPPRPPSLLRRVVAAARRNAGGLLETLKYFLRIDDLGFFFAPAVMASTLERLRGSSYMLFIGVEREGLMWAGEMGRRTGVPTAYYSLELYTNDLPHTPIRRFRRIKRLERRYHRECVATIVQDAPRAKILFEDNGVPRSTVHYVPVSLLGPARTQRRHVLHDRLGLSRDSRVILVLGQMHALRYSQAAVSAAQEFPEGWVLVVHGPAHGARELLEEMARLNTRGRARVSTELIPEGELSDFVASADVGVAVYSPATPNEYWTGRASEKVARYAQAGVPMIAFDYPSFRDVFDRFHCGRVISDFSALKDELKVIFDDYAAYRAGAFRAYADLYEFSRQFAPVVDWMDANLTPVPVRG